MLPRTARVIANLRHAIDALNTALECTLQDQKDMRARLDAEYAKHVPHFDLGASDLRLGNTASAAKFWCQHCREPWPCREWHAYRRIHGWDTRQYEPLRLVPKPTGERA